MAVYCLKISRYKVLLSAGALILSASFALNSARADGPITGGVIIPENSKIAEQIGIAAEGATRGVSAPGAAIGDAAAVGVGAGGSSSASDGGSSDGGDGSGGGGGSSGDGGAGGNSNSGK